MPTAIVQRLLRSGLQYTRARLEILELELTAERQRVGALMKCGLALSLGALTSVQFLAILVLALSWDTPWRLHALFALIACAVTGTVLVWRAMRRLQQQAPRRPLAAALHDLDRIGE